MSTAPQDLADKLLDAQVQFVLAEVSGDRLAEVVARDVADVLKVAETMIVADTVDSEEVKVTARKVADQIGGSTLVEEMVTAFADGIYDLSASDDYKLGDLIAREPVEKLIEQVLSMHTLQERGLNRLTESPLVATVVSSFVNKIVGDFLQENRKRAEKVPGVGSLLSIGTSAANRVKSAADKHLEPYVGDLAGKGAQYALKQSNNAIRELIRDAPLQAAAMELWDLHADEPIGVLREYLSGQELRETIVIVHDIVMSARNTEYFGHVVDECIDVFYEKYGSHSIASLLPELGIDSDDITTEILRYAPAVIEAAKANGQLEQLIRERLEPFFRSDAVTAILAEPAAS